MVDSARARHPFHSGRRLPRPLDRARRTLGAIGFAPRLFLALGIALLLVGAVAYVLISDRLEQQQIDSYVHIQEADVEGFELIARDVDR